MLLGSKDSFQKRLLEWYGRNRRDLPWRRTRDPYRIWVSEIMLQQTQVDTVIPYYERWLERFPTLESLAKAPLSEALKYWAGLGYYRRARMLHEAARIVRKTLGGEIPKTAEALRKLPGIGRYTAGAIASIAFGQKAPILDGNVIRVLARLTALKQDISLPKTLGKLWGISEEILPEKNTGDFNQALMELGATVCLPPNPKCAACPVSNFCEALKLERTLDFPVNRRKEKIIPKNHAALLWQEKGRVLLQRQAKNARWGGLWMFPHRETKDDLIRDFGLGKIPLRKHLRLTHAFTKYRIRLDVFKCENAGSFKTPKTKGGRWMPVKLLSGLALPAPHKKIARSILKNDV